MSEDKRGIAAGVAGGRADDARSLFVSSLSKGHFFGRSPQLIVTQERVDAFADATDDHQFIHRKDAVERGSPFSSPIVHGFLLVSLLAPMLAHVVPSAPTVVNMAVDAVRFRKAVPVGAAIVYDATLHDITARPHHVTATFDVRCTIINGGEERLAMTAEWTVRYVVEPRSRL